MKKINLFLFFFLLCAAIGIAQNLPIGYWGYVTIDGIDAPASTKIEAYEGAIKIGETNTPTIAGQADNSYKLNIIADDNSDIIFKVWGIVATTETWLLAQSGNVLNINLSVNKIANGNSCSYDLACQSGHCCSGTCLATCGTGNNNNNLGGSGGGSGGSGGGSASQTQDDAQQNALPARDMTGFMSALSGGDDAGTQEEQQAAGTPTQLSAGAGEEGESGMEDITGAVTGVAGKVSSPAALLIAFAIAGAGFLGYAYLRRR